MLHNTDRTIFAIAIIIALCSVAHALSTMAGSI